MSWASSSSGWSSFSEERIREIVVQSGGASRIVELAARYQVPEFVIRGWQSRYGSLQPAREEATDANSDVHLATEATPLDAGRLAHLEEENAKLRRILADLALENRTLKERAARTA